MLASICDEGVYWVRKMCNPIWKLCELNNHLTILSGLRNPWRLDRLVKCSGWDPLSQFSAPVWAAQLYSFHWRIIDDDRRSMMIWKSCHICGEIDRLLIFISFFFLSTFSFFESVPMALGVYTDFTLCISGGGPKWQSWCLWWWYYFKNLTEWVVFFAIDACIFNPWLKCWLTIDFLCCFFMPWRRFASTFVPFHAPGERFCFSWFLSILNDARTSFWPSVFIEFINSFHPHTGEHDRTCSEWKTIAIVPVGMLPE